MEQNKDNKTDILKIVNEGTSLVVQWLGICCYIYP